MHVAIHTGTCDKRFGSGPCSVGSFFISPLTLAPPLRGAFLCKGLERQALC